MKNDDCAAILRHNLKFLQGGRTNEEMAMIIGAAAGATWRDRIKHPEKIRLSELEKLCRYFRLPLPELLTERLDYFRCVTRSGKEATA